MAKKPSIRDLGPSQWFYVAAPSVVAPVVAWLGRHELEGPSPLVFVAGGLGLSALLLFVMVYGEQL